MVLHSFLFSAALLIFPYESIFVQSIIFFIHVTLGFPLDFFPHTLSSNKTRCVLPLEPLNTCPAYSNFLFFISFLHSCSNSIENCIIFYFIRLTYLQNSSVTPLF